MTASRDETVNGPAWTSSSRPTSSSGDSSLMWRSWLDYRSLPVRSMSEDRYESTEDFGGSSTALSAVGAVVRQPSTYSTFGTGDTVSSSVSSRSSSSPSEGGIHGWWLAGERSSPSLSSH